MKQKKVRIGVTEASMVHLIANEGQIDTRSDYARRKLWYARNAIGFYDKSFRHSTEWGDHFLWETHCDEALRRYFDLYRKSAASSSLLALLGLSLKDADTLFVGGSQNLIELFSPAPVVRGLSMRALTDACAGRKLIIVHSFAPLVQAQVERGAVSAIRPEFKPSQIAYVKFPYCYLNSGPDKDSFATIDRISEQIVAMSDLDTCVVVGVGSQGVLIAEKLQNEGIEVLSYGGDLQLFFGIMGNRWRNIDHKSNPLTNSFVENKDAWVEEVPEYLIPENSKKIEDGCYW